MAGILTPRPPIAPAERARAAHARMERARAANTGTGRTEAVHVQAGRAGAARARTAGLLDRLREERRRRPPDPGGQGSSALRFWTWLSVVVSVFAITAHEDFGALRFAITGLVTAGFVFSWHRRRRRNTWVKVLLTVGCLVAAWEFLRALGADPSHTSVPLTVFLLWLQTLHSFDLPRRRDLLFSLLSSAVLVAVAAAFSIDVTFGAYLLAYVAAVCAALICNAAESGAEGAAAASGGRDVPAPPRPMPAREGVGSAARLMGAVALVGTVLFLLTPRPPGLFISTFPFAGRVPLGDPLRGEIVNPAYPEGTRYGQVFNPGGYFGFSPTVDLRLRGRLNDAVVMRVRTLERRLLRGLVFDTYTGTGWEIGDHTVTEHKARIPPVELLRGHDEVYGYRLRDRRLVQTFYIERHQPNVLFAVPRAERVYLPHGWAYVDRYSAVRLPFVLEPGMIYTVVSRPLDAPVETLRAARGDYPSFITERYLQLPPGLPGRVRALAQEVSAGAATQYERVVAINRYLWTRYRYDLTIGPQRRPGDAVDYFLFEEPRGYCEQFASAMVVLLRSIGVPARLVTGYTPGTYQPLTGLLEVRNLDAHAWVEVLFPGLGWVEFEPTPGFVDPAVAEARFMPRWGWEGVGHFLRDRLGTSLAGISLAGILGSGRLPLEKHGFVWLALMAAVLGGLALGRQAVRRRDRSPVHEIWSAYGLLIRLLARRGLLRRPAETPGEFGRRAQAVVDWPEVSALTALLERAAYGPEGAAPAMVGEARLHAQVLRQREGHRHGFMPSLRRR